MQVQQGQLPEGGLTAEQLKGKQRSYFSVSLMCFLILVLNPPSRPLVGTYPSQTSRILPLTPTLVICLEGLSLELRRRGEWAPL